MSSIQSKGRRKQGRGFSRQRAGIRVYRRFVHWERLEDRALLSADGLLASGVDDPPPPPLVRAEAVLTEYLRPDDLGDNPVQRPRVETVYPGDEFLLNVYAQDIREDDGVPGETDEFGLYAAYFDIHFDSAAFSVPDGPSLSPNRQFDFPVSYLNPAHRTSFGSALDGTRVSTAFVNFPNGPYGELHAAEGWLEHVGGFSDRMTPLGNAIPAVPAEYRDVFLNQHVFDIPFTVESLYAVDDAVEVRADGSVSFDVLANDGLVVGDYTFQLSGASGVGKEILTFGDNATATGAEGFGSIVPEENIDFVHGTLTVALNGRELTFEGLMSEPAQGELTGSGGQFTYTPDPGAAGTDSFTYHVSDGQGRSKMAEVTITIVPPPALRVIDDTDSGFSIERGEWGYGTAGFQETTRWAAGGTGAAAASWTFAVAPGTYEVAATWGPAANRATNAPYSVRDGAQTLDTVRVNQQQSAADFQDQGAGWHVLGVFEISSEQLIVQLTNDANGFVMADAIRIEVVDPDDLPEPPPPPPPPPPEELQIIDNVDAGFSTPQGSWGTGLLGYQGDSRFAAGGGAVARAQWTFVVQPGTYQVAATWPAASNRATNAPYSVRDGAQTLDTVRVNQQQSPADFQDQGAGWHVLGVFEISSEQLVVQLTNEANGFVMADAIRIEAVETALLSELPSTADGFPTPDESEGWLAGQGSSWTISVSGSPANTGWVGTYRDVADRSDTWRLRPQPSELQNPRVERHVLNGFAITSPASATRGSAAALISNPHEPRASADRVFEDPSWSELLDPFNGLYTELARLIRPALA